jgi:hypothetical protein
MRRLRLKLKIADPPFSEGLKEQGVGLKGLGRKAHLQPTTYNMQHPTYNPQRTKCSGFNRDKIFVALISLGAPQSTNKLNQLNKPINSLNSLNHSTSKLFKKVCIE